MEKRNEEYEEEDVWGVIRAEKKREIKTTRSCLSISRNLPSASRMIPPGPHHHDDHDDGDDDDGGMKMKMHHSSAPVNIPDWSKIYGKSPSLRGLMNDEEDDDDVHDDGHRPLALPPHEWLARKMARSQITSFSVCEGAGRTLKGRDLSRVRHAVLSKTGFI